MLKVKLTIKELARRSDRPVDAMYYMRKKHRAQYRLLVIGALTELIEEAKVDEILRML